jgi:hypothetical protein
MVYSGGNGILRSPRSLRIATKSRLGSFVSFAGKVEIYYTLGRKDYSKSGREAKWFDERDHRRTMERCLRILKRDGEGGFAECMRGLEKWSTLGIAMNAINRGDAYGAVLDEQAVQRDKGEYCDERIAKNYRNVSRRCQKTALKLARQDAIEASKYLARVDSSPTRLDGLWKHCHYRVHQAAHWARGI